MSSGVMGCLNKVLQLAKYGKDVKIDSFTHGLLQTLGPCLNRADCCVPVPVVKYGAVPTQERAIYQPPLMCCRRLEAQVRGCHGVSVGTDSDARHILSALAGKCKLLL